jgi:hypothetical protein
VREQEEWAARYERRFLHEQQPPADRRARPPRKKPPGRTDTGSDVRRPLPVVELGSPPPRRRPAKTDPLLDRIVGCLLAGALGDALGYPVEFDASGVALLKKYGAAGPSSLTYAGEAIGHISDDTQMTLFVAEGLIRAHQRFIERGPCSVVHVIVHALMRWYSTQGKSVPGPVPADGWLVAEPRLRARRAPGNTSHARARASREAKE